ncbi:MAG: TonB-dependent receptor plug domain-containing protein [Saprospiraceae bacterium]|nr:TonB-dependent receptor plug domain-containing protein [Saprospiraceae bacterium]
MSNKLLTASIRIFLFFTLLIGSQLVSAQGIEGKIVSDRGEKVSYVYISNQTRHFQTISNEAGKFSLPQARAGDTLYISSLGYEPKSLVLDEGALEKPLRLTLRQRAYSLEQVVVSNQRWSLSQLSKMRLATDPVNSSQEVLQAVPGLFIGQHAGGGKAEQIFLRGFDIDHGTDVRLTVDGMPVNMVSHAHGQGYADLHFLIPETIDMLDYGKGPYYSDKGNLATAGYVDFSTKEKLNSSSLTLEYGQFNTFRTLGLFNILDDKAGQNAYLAAEYLLSDGPFESPQDFHRLNMFGKYTIDLRENDKLSLQASHFDSRWDASGQIPERAVASGLIGRFGAIDDTEGGQTSRTNFLARYTHAIDERTFLNSHAFFSSYDFELYSNFTFFLNDPDNGDQIRQKERRSIFGFESTLQRELGNKFSDHTIVELGAGMRNDDVRGNELSRTLNRERTLRTLALGDINEWNLYSYADLKLAFGKFLLNPALRVDFFHFSYLDELESEGAMLSERASTISPKLNLLYNPRADWQLFLKTGIGYHSNDSRVVVTQSARETLPKAYGADLGTNWKPTDRLHLNASLWHLYLEQEFVYVGDEGIVEPSGRTRRSGIDLGARYQATDWLFVDADINYAHARSVEGPRGRNFIPLAPEWTATAGLSVQHPTGFSGGVRTRLISDRPANEDGSLVAKGFVVTDINLNYAFDRLQLGVAIDNLFDVEWREAQFATESRLARESRSVEEIHFTPGTPFFFETKIGYRF